MDKEYRNSAPGPAPRRTAPRGASGRAAMDRPAFDAFCSTLPHAHHVVQWGGCSVWKVAGKVFAIGSSNAGAALAVTFKVSPLAFEVLKDQPGLRPAPYLASRGMAWIQRTGAQSMSDKALKDYITESHRLVALGLPKKVQRELGLDASCSPAGAAGKARTSP